MAVTYATTGYLYYGGGIVDNPPATANSASSNAYVVTDVDEDGNIDSNDYWAIDNVLYTGTTVTINGSDYAVFQQTSANFFVPYDSEYDNLSAYTDTSTWTFNSVPENAVVANCFLTGTRIATPEGEAKVEDLRIGDQVTTPDGRIVDVKWVARQTYRQFANMPIPEKHAPVCISAGALGNGLPHTDLYLTADHGMIIEEMIVNAGAMVNGSTIRFLQVSELPETFTYYHIETEAHDEILANGAASETFIDYVGRSTFDNYQEYLDLYGAERIIQEMPRPRISAQRLLTPGLRARLGLSLPANTAMPQSLAS